MSKSVEITCPHCGAVGDVLAPEPDCVLPVYECECGWTWTEANAGVERTQKAKTGGTL